MQGRVLSEPTAWNCQRATKKETGSASKGYADCQEMNPADQEAVTRAVGSWFGGEHSMFDYCTEVPEVAWAAILEILKRDLTDDQRALLAGGPLETLLAWHGAAFIEREEQEARRNAAFKALLGGVWRQDMPQEIWDRVLKVRGPEW